jgi:hypothetical protein
MLGHAGMQEALERNESRYKPARAMLEARIAREATNG